MAAGGVDVALKGGWEGDPGGVGQSCVATMVVVTQSEIQNYTRSAPIRLLADTVLELCKM